MLKRMQHLKFQRSHEISIHIYFLILTLLLCSVFFISGKLRFGDLFFNYFRFREVGLDLLHGQFPQFNFFTGTILGGATNTFYPWLTILPLLPLMHFLSPLSWWIFLIGFGFMMGFEIAYFSSQTTRWSHRDSFIFANFYVLSLIAIDYVYFGNDIGGFYSMLLAPLVLFGWQQWIKRGRWQMMTFGLLLICFTHLITVIILGIMLSLLTIIFIKQLNKYKLVNLSKAIVLFLGSSSIIWLPMLILMATNKIYTPSEFSMPWLQRPLIIKPLSAYLNFYGDNCFSIVDVLALLLLLINWRKVSSSDKRFAGVGLIFLVINFQPIAKWLVINTVFSNFQFMHRFSFCSHLLLSIVLVDIIHLLIQKHGWQSIRCKLVYPVIGFMIVMMLGAGHLYLAENNQKPVDHITSVTMANPTLRKQGSSVVNANNLSHPIFWHVLMNTYSDYYPRSEVHIIKRNGVIVPQINIPMLNHTSYTSSGNLIENVYHRGIYTLPMVIYHHQRYVLKVNGEPQMVRSNHQFLKTHLRPGKNIISLETPMMWYRYLALMISIISMIIFLYLCYKDRHKIYIRLSKPKRDN